MVWADYGDTRDGRVEKAEPPAKTIGISRAAAEVNGVGAN
jgi:hypothetical protein